jgi:hypothetical protein
MKTNKQNKPSTINSQPSTNSELQSRTGTKKFISPPRGMDLSPQTADTKTDTKPHVFGSFG